MINRLKPGGLNFSYTFQRNATEILPIQNQEAVLRCNDLEVLGYKSHYRNCGVLVNERSYNVDTFFTDASEKLAFSADSGRNIKLGRGVTRR